MTSSRLGAGLLALAAMTAAAQTSSKQDKLLHLNQIQVVGSHNSYNTGFAPSEEKYFSTHFPEAFHGVDYHHQSLPKQLDAGVRQLELDIVTDPAGGRFSHPKIVGLTKEAGLPADPDFDPQHEMDKPGFKVIHLGDVNQRSSCQTFVHCLQDIRGWSKAHPKHVPILLLIEDKQGRLSQLPGATTAEPWTAETWNALDAEIRAVFGPDHLIAPEQVQEGHASLRDAAMAHAWPSLAQARGKVVFVLNDGDARAKAYQGQRKSLEGRAMFVATEADSPLAAFLSIPDPLKDGARIRQAVQQGLMVLTRADAETREARENNGSRRTAAIASGAQIVQTDFAMADRAVGPYRVSLAENSAAMCGAKLSPEHCVRFTDPSLETRVLAAAVP